MKCVGWEETLCTWLSSSPLNLKKVDLSTFHIFNYAILYGIYVGRFHKVSKLAKQSCFMIYRSGFLYGSPRGEHLKCWWSAWQNMCEDDLYIVKSTLNTLEHYRWVIKCCLYAIISKDTRSVGCLSAGGPLLNGVRTTECAVDDFISQRLLREKRRECGVTFWGEPRARLEDLVTDGLFLHVLLRGHICCFQYKPGLIYSITKNFLCTKA